MVKHTQVGVTSRLISPLAKSPCVRFSVSLIEIIQESGQAQRGTYFIFFNSFQYTVMQKFLKTIPLVLITALLLTTVSVMAQTVNYKQPFTIDRNGTIKDNSGASVGLVTKDQLIMDAKGQKIAFVDGQGNLVDAKTGKKMGRMGKNGRTYANAEGELLFTLRDKADKTCDIFDVKGNKIGNVYDSYKSSACAIHCFNNGLDSRTHRPN